MTVTRNAQNFTYPNNYVDPTSTAFLVVIQTCYILFLIDAVTIPTIPMTVTRTSVHQLLLGGCKRSQVLWRNQTMPK